MSSQNYNLATPESDKDYKWIEFPSAEDLFQEKTLNIKISENYSAWDVRNFLKYLMKANPNALELLFSVEQEYYDKNFEELLNYIRPRVGAIIRQNWKNFTSATYGIAWESVRRNSITPKTVARLLYFYLFWFTLLGEEDWFTGNGEMTENTWRRKNSVWPQKIRKLDPNDPKTQKELDSLDKLINHDWVPENYKIVPQPDDEKICEEIRQKVLNYFEVSLTSC